MEMPSGFTPSCLAKGRARRCRMPGESLGRSSLWLVNLIFLSDLQQRRRKVQPSLLPVQIQDGSGHWGSRAWQPACPGWHRDRAVPTGSSVPWLWVWHHCCQPHPRQPCSPQGAPEVGTQVAQGSQEQPGAGSVSPVHSGDHTCPHHGVTCTAGASPTPPWNLWDYGSAQMGTWHRQTTAPDPNTSCMTPGNEPSTCLGSTECRADAGRIQAGHKE